ncbi:MAG: hypothetical protein HY651_11765 [Acidobacteria bacterium]|nr:hypothetical protein [Acidobacteriota bacterium]
MKGFFRGAVPPARDILLIESGSEEIFRRALEGIRRSFPEARLHLVTCWPGLPPVPLEGLYRVQDYASRWDKLRLIRSFRKKPPDVLAILCSQEKVMYWWKMLALLVVPAKTLIINENGDFFWLDWQNFRTLRRFLQSRWGLIGTESLFTSLRALAFPLILLFLLANALFLYARRWRRLLLWRIRGGGGHRRGRTPQLW